MTSKFLLTIFLSLSFSFITAQECEVFNGDFETWVDVTEDYTEDLELLEPVPPGTILLPDGYFSFFRFFFSIIGDVFGTLFGEELEAFAATSLGVCQTTDATIGEYAVKIGGDESFNIADLFGVSEYIGSMPSSFLVDVKHVGGGNDSLFILGTFGDTEELDLDDETFDGTAGYFLVEHADNADSEYQTISIPVINNSNGIANDTLIMQIIVLGDEDLIAAGEESYFILDNMRFDKNDVLSQNTLDLQGRFSEGKNHITVQADLRNDISSASLLRSISADDNFETIADLNLDQESNYQDSEIEANKIYYYKVEAEMTNGATMVSDLISIKTGSVISRNPLSIFPSPVDDTSVINLDLDTDLHDASCAILDMTGKKVKDVELPSLIAKGNHLYDLSASDLAPGIYTCQLTSAASSWSILFMVR